MPTEAPKFSSAQKAFDALVRDHVPGAFVYRGQTSRVVVEVRETGNVHRLESIFPSDYRHLKEAIQDPEHFPPEEVTRARAPGRDRRDRFLLFLLTKAWDPSCTAFDSVRNVFRAEVAHHAELARAARNDERALENVLRAALKGRFHRWGWSLAQHYGITTSLTDVTFSPDVAMWFATNPWNAGAPLRVNRLEQVLNVCTTVFNRSCDEHNIPHIQDLFIEDIQQIPLTFAARPAGQLGGSVYGFDQWFVIRTCMKHGVIETFDFVQGPDHPSLQSTRESVKPEQDPFFALLREFERSETTVPQ